MNVRMLLTGGGVLIAAGAVFLLYNRATEVDRHTPSVAVQQFIVATFVEKDDSRVRLFTCPEWTSRRTAEARRWFDPDVKVKWERVTEQSRQDKRAVVTARLQLLWRDFADFQEWRFEVVEAGGWRVCDARTTSA
jgi:hypothetical protein